jgi:O-antigen biosynthesis protein
MPSLEKPSPPTPFNEGFDRSAFGGEGSWTQSELASLVAFQRARVDSLRSSGDVRSLRVEELLLNALLEKLAGEVAPAQQPDPVLARLESLADTIARHLPVSHRPGAAGKLVSAGKRVALFMLRPVQVEALRAQQRFNHELVTSLRIVQAAGSSSLRADLPEFIGSNLRNLADPRETQLQTHRSGVAAAVVMQSKRLALSGARPFLERPLQTQAQWNRAAIDALRVAALWDSDRERKIAAVEALRAHRDPLGSHPAPREALLVEWFRRQTTFNHEFTEAVAKLFGLSAPRDDAGGPADYQKWVAAREPLEIQKAARNLGAILARPTFSILTPVYNTAEPVLRACIESVLGQLYPRWELCLVDDGSDRPEVQRILNEYARCDPRIRVETLSNNGGIARATNAALAEATGEYVAFLDHDDVLAPHALAEMALRISQQRDLDLLYSDEDRLDEAGRRANPFFKPDWSPDLLRACNYICHLVVIRRSLLESLGGIREGFEGAQDYDLLLRVSERTERIGHVPRILYHWRASTTSMAADVQNKPHASDAGLRAVAEHLRRTGARATASSPSPTIYRPIYSTEPDPLVSIIVPFKDKPRLLSALVPSVLRATYRNFELLLVSNNSTDPETFRTLDSFTDPRIRKLEWNHPFNFQTLNNWAASEAKGEILLFLNNDIEALDDSWLGEMVGQALRPEVGAVGAKLVFPSGLLQHAGVVVGLHGFAGHVFAGLPDQGVWTHFGHADWTRNYLAVTCACMAMRRQVFEDVGGFDESFLVCGGDVDLCLRIGARGLRIVYTPYARLQHDESATRRGDQIPERDFWRSFASYRHWLSQGDPYFNPNLSLISDRPQLRTDDSSAEALAVRVLATELPGSKAATATKGKVEEQRRLFEHLPTLDVPDVGAVSKLLTQNGQAVRRTASGRGIRTITWLVPFFRHPYGGVHTILRFGDVLRRRRNVESRFVIYDNPHASAREAEARARVLFADAPGTFQVLRRREEITTLPPTDVVMATFWMSAYFAMRHPRAKARMYFVQDFEPLFYPAGTLYGLAEETYRLGLFGLFNTPGLRDFVVNHYPMEGLSFTPAVDHGIFHARGRPARDVTRILFYGRPSVDRNAFELGAAVLRDIKARFGDRVEIVSAGEIWDPERFGLGGVVKNLGVLPYESTGDLYRSCDIGLCFMFTKHPSYLPMEMMACGVAVVSNDNPANRWFYQDGVNALVSLPTLRGIGEQVARLVEDDALRRRLSDAGVQQLARTDWEKEILAVFDALGSLPRTESESGPRVVVSGAPQLAGSARQTKL